MAVGESDDRAIRLAAFEHVRRLSQLYDPLTSAHLRAGFTYNGERIPLINPQRGIFKPRKMLRLLSIRTVYPKSGNRIWYDDQRQVHQQIFDGDEVVEYAFMGDNPDAADNRWLREAWETQTPIIYFLGVAPGRYQAIVPTFVAGWDRGAKEALIAFGEQREQSAESVLTTADIQVERRYALRAVKQRLHQASFREAVLTAYKGRCAFSGLPEQRLLDAAHIMSDKHETLGQPVVQNGLPLSKIHHAAFDAHLIGVDPDYKIHVSGQLLAQKDGPMLEALKGMHLRPIILPKREQDWPDRERLAERFDLYKST